MTSISDIFTHPLSLDELVSIPLDQQEVERWSLVEPELVQAVCRLLSDKQKQRSDLTKPEHEHEHEHGSESESESESETETEQDQGDTAKVSTNQLDQLIETLFDENIFSLQIIPRAGVQLSINFEALLAKPKLMALLLPPQTHSTQAEEVPELLPLSPSFQSSSDAVNQGNHSFSSEPEFTLSSPISPLPETSSVIEEGDKVAQIIQSVLQSTQIPLSQPLEADQVVPSLESVPLPIPLSPIYGGETGDEPHPPLQYSQAQEQPVSPMPTLQEHPVDECSELDSTASPSISCLSSVAQTTPAHTYVQEQYGDFTPLIIPTTSTSSSSATSVLCPEESYSSNEDGSQFLAAEIAETKSDLTPQDVLDEKLNRNLKRQASLLRDFESNCALRSSPVNFDSALSFSCSSVNGAPDSVHPLFSCPESGSSATSVTDPTNSTLNSNSGTG